MVNDPSDERGQTSSVANLLLAAIAIVAVGTLGYYGFQMAGKLSAGPPTSELQTTYDRAAGEVRIELINGDAIDTDHLRIEGGVAPRESWPDDSLTASEAVTYAANPGDEVQVIVLYAADQDQADAIFEDIDAEIEVTGDISEDERDRLETGARRSPVWTLMRMAHDMEPRVSVTDAEVMASD